MERIPQDSNRYPRNLREISGAPKYLFVLGEMNGVDMGAIAVVGSRKPSRKGKENAYDFAHFLAAQGYTIVSGLAKGIDTVAHQAALAVVGGRTIAVLGSGLDIIYPRENQNLAKVISRRGAVVSEYPQGTKPEGSNFLARNRIISGLSRAVLVVEGQGRSGTLNTAGHAADQGRDVYAIPGSPATDFLIGDGATAVMTPQELLDFLRTNTF